MNLRNDNLIYINSKNCNCDVELTSCAISHEIVENMITRILDVHLEKLSNMGAWHKIADKLYKEGYGV